MSHFKNKSWKSFIIFISNLFQTVITCSYYLSLIFLPVNKEAYLFTCSALLVEIRSLLITRCKITCYLLQNSPVTCCRSCFLQKITRYLFQKLLIEKIHLLLVAKLACYLLQKLVVTKVHSLVIAKLACHSSQKLLVAKIRLL